MSNPADIFFYGYKEPLKKSEGGYGYQGVLCYNQEKDKVLCHFCGRFFRAINNGHLGKIHGMTAEEYKQKIELSQNSALLGEGTRIKYMERPRSLEHLKNFKKAIKKRSQLIKQGRWGGHKMTLEHKNKKGTCPDQLLDLISKTVKSFGRVPTLDEFCKFHNGKYYGSIRKTYGTWSNALAKLKLQNTVKRFSKEHLVIEIKNFFNVHKRTPRWSDFQRGLLPSSHSYFLQFKGLNHARLLAGVPLILLKGAGSSEWIPSKIQRRTLLKQFGEI